MASGRDGKARKVGIEARDQHGRNECSCAVNCPAGRGIPLGHAVKRSEFPSHKATLVFCFDHSYKFLLRHPSNHTRDRACGEHAKSCQSTRVFEDMNQLREKRVQESFH